MAPSLLVLPDISSMTVVICISIVVFVYAFYYHILSKRLPLPPGPKGRYPLLGMTFDMPKKRPWDQLGKWAELHGPIMHVRVGLQHYIYISSGEVAREFLDKRSQIYSSRPPSVVGQIITNNRRSVLMPYDNHWRGVRKIFAGLLTAKKCDEYTAIQEKEAIASLHDLASHPEDYTRHLHRFALSAARSIAYGRRVQNFEDPFAKDIKTLMENFSRGMTPGKYVVESMPLLRLLPEPLQPWMRELGPIRDYENQSNLNNYRQALVDAEKHPERKSVARDFTKTARELVGAEISEEQAATSCNEILGVGSETISTALTIMIQACVAFPEVVEKAHEELDRVIGRNRMPTWQDEPNLPYIRGIVKETLRWRTLAPFGFPHYSTSEDVYAGYRIPKGSIVIVNNWAIHKDPKRYPEPDRFYPERFLHHDLSSAAYAHSANVRARDHFSYGSGKRICPGIHLAERGLFCFISRLLQVFQIKPALDAAGNEIAIDIDAYRTGLVASPEKFRARFEMRNDEVRNMLDREWKSLFEGHQIESWDFQ